jgi:hypothetical protein
MAKFTRTIPENEFVAESLEKLAEGCSGEEAQILRSAALIYRTHPSKNQVRVEDVN